MSEVNAYSSDHVKLDRLVNNVQLVEPEPDSDSSNDNNSSVNASQVPLLVTVGPPTEEPLGRMGLALDEGSNRERRTEGGLCQRTALATQNTNKSILIQ